MFITSNTLPVLISNTERILDVRGKTTWTPTGGRVTVLPPCAMAADATAVTRSVTPFLSRPAPLKLMQGIRFAIVYKQYISAVISLCFLIWMFKIIWEGMERHNRAMRMLKGAFVKFAKGGEALYQFLMTTKSTLDTQLSMMHENTTKMKRFVSEKIDGDARKKYLDGVKAFRVQVATGTKNKVANIAQRANSARKELTNKARDIRGHFNKILPEAKNVLQTIAGGEFLKFKDEVGKFALSTINKMDETFNAIQSAGKKIVPSTGHIITKKIEDDRGDDEVDELHQERATELDSEIGKIARRLLRFWTVLKGNHRKEVQ